MIYVLTFELEFWNLQQQKKVILKTKLMIGWRIVTRSTSAQFLAQIPSKMKTLHIPTTAMRDINGMSRGNVLVRKRCSWGGTRFDSQPKSR